MSTVCITPDQDVIVAEIQIAAPPDRVFQAITDPQQVPQWWGQLRYVPRHQLGRRLAPGRQMAQPWNPRRWSPVRGPG